MASLQWDVYFSSIYSLFYKTRVERRKDDRSRNDTRAACNIVV